MTTKYELAMAGLAALARSNLRLDMNGLEQKAVEIPGGIGDKPLHGHSCLREAL
jgi:hypothetical protein